MKKNFIYYLSPTILRGFITLFVVVPLSTYYLEPKDFGIVAILTVFSSLVIPLSSTGVGWVLGGNYYKLDSFQRKELIFNILSLSVFLRTVWVIVFGATGFLFLPKLISSYENKFLLFFWLYLLAEWFNSIWEVVSYVIVLQKKGRAHTVLDITQLIGYLIVLVVCLVVFRLKTISLVLAYLGNALGGFIFSIIYVRKYVIPRIRLKWIKEIAKLGFPTIPLNLFERISNSIERLFIERWIGLSRLGIYNHALDYKKMLMRPFKAFSRAYSPEVLEGVSKKDDIKIRYGKDMLKKWYGLLTLGGAGVALFSKEAISFLTHDKFTQAAPIVSIWFILILVYSFGIPYSQFLFAKRKNKFVFWSDIVVGIISWGVIALFVKFFGIAGAAAAIVLYFFILHSIRKIYAIKIGCIDFDGVSFYVALFIILGLVIFNICFFSLFFKALIFLGSSFVIVRYFGLFSSLKRIWQKKILYSF
jgi:O-antigen/teichoic acid export membrane protein